MSKEELVLTDYLGVLARRKWFIAAITLVVTAFTYWWSMQEVVVYRSRARLKIQRQMSFASMFDEFMVSTGDPLNNHMYEIMSYTVASNAAARLAYPSSPDPSEIADVRNSISVQRIERSDILDVFTTGSSPMESKKRGDAVVEAFIIQHDLAMRKNAREVLESIEKSHRTLIEGLKERESELLESLGPRLVGGRSEDELAPLRKRLAELDMKLNQLRLSGNYTEDYPEIVNTRNQVREIEKALHDKLESEFERRTQLAEYERYKVIMDDIGAFFARKIEEARIAAEKKSEIIRVIEPPSPGRPLGTARLRKTIAGGLLGLMAGIILAFVADNLDTSVRTLAEIEDVFRLPVLGVIPHFSQNEAVTYVGSRRRFGSYFKKILPVESFNLLVRAFSVAVLPEAKRKKTPENVNPAQLIVPFSPRSPATESYRTLQTNILLASREGARVFMITSASPEEGKTTTIANLAISFAQSGKRTLLVGANMRRPQLYQIFGLSRERGLSDIFLGDLAWRDAVKDQTDVALGDGAGNDLATAPGMDNLFFITCGARTAQPAEWLAQPVFSDLLKEWGVEYDIVLVDSPPAIPVPDSVILADKVGKVVLVYQLGVTGRESVRRAIISIQNTGAKILGIALNDIRSNWVDQSEFYHYKTYYGRPE